MTDTSPKAVERLSPTRDIYGHACLVADLKGGYVRHSDYAALSAQLEAANQRHAAAETAE